MQSDRYLLPIGFPFLRCLPCIYGFASFASSKYLQEIKRPRRNLRGLRCGLLRKLLLLTETLFELSDASTSIEDALLACVERVAD